MMRHILKSQKGQTAVEYIMLIAMAVSLGLLFFKKMDQYILKNPNSFISKPLNKLKNDLGRPEDRYKTFPLFRAR